MASYIITFRLSNSDSSTYQTRRDTLYKYFNGYKPSTTETEEGTTSTIFWKSEKPFVVLGKNREGNTVVSSGIVSDLMDFLNKDDELLIIQLIKGSVEEVGRIKNGRYTKRDSSTYDLLF